GKHPTMLHEQELKTFVEGTTNFFEVAAQQPASIGSPYPMEGSPAGPRDHARSGRRGRQHHLRQRAPRLRPRLRDLGAERAVGREAADSAEAGAALVHHPDQLAQSLRQTGRVAHLTVPQPRGPPQRRPPNTRAGSRISARSSANTPSTVSPTS